jgi:serine/threonine protein kinase
MLLASGTRLRPYEVSEPLGAGGMGEVYRARDTRLVRTARLWIRLLCMQATVPLENSHTVESGLAVHEECLLGAEIPLELIEVVKELPFSPIRMTA